MFQFGCMNMYVLCENRGLCWGGIVGRLAQRCVQFWRYSRSLGTEQDGPRYFKYFLSMTFLPYSCPLITNPLVECKIISAVP
jgi:hypothetical protein